MVKMHEITCLNCGKTIKTYNPDRKFCSLKCHRQYLVKLSIQAKLIALETIEKQTQEVKTQNE
jgi:endogenous inhibitor of DNA gyrase (YacG/DUF329 family)